ncbi:MAG: hypothetical protein M0Z75_17125 [Nitrospiraceae bacterium]|nr:hypothetical protein [Nitrospiraceae bacterium]
MKRKAAFLALIAFSVSFIILPRQAVAAPASMVQGHVSTASVTMAGRAAPGPSLIGNAYPKGMARVFLAGQWLKLNGICPVAPGEVFSTAGGTISFLFTDGTRMDVGGGSAVYFKAGPGGGHSYVIALVKGRIGINGGSLSKFAVQTPDDLLMSPGKAGFIGGLYFDGGRTIVKTLSGGLTVKKDLSAQKIKKVTVGYAGADGAGDDDGTMAPNAQAGSSDPGASGGAGAAGGGSVAAALAIGGAEIAGTIAGVTVEQNRGWSEASPYSP